MVILRITLLLDIPVLDGADNMSFIGRPELNFHLIPSLCVEVLKKKIETSCTGL